MDPSQMMPRSYPMWPPPAAADAMPPPQQQLPFLPPPNASLAPNRGWKRKHNNPNPNPNSSAGAYQPPAVGDLQVQNRAKARRWFKPNGNPNSNPNRRPFFHSNKPKAKAPRNTSSFIIRAKRAGGIAPLVSPCPVTPAVLPTPVISPARDEGLLSDVLAQRQWGVDGYGSMKGLIRLRPAINAAPGGGAASDDEDEGNSSGGSDVEEHVEVERRLDHDLSRFEMVYPQPPGGGEYALFEEDDEYDHRGGGGGQDDVDVHVARLEEENLTLKERLFLMEQEVGDMRRRLEAIEARFSDGAVSSAENAAAAAVEARENMGDANAASAISAAAAAAVEARENMGDANAASAISAAAADDDAVEQALENGIERGNANAAAGPDNAPVEETLKNDIEMGDAAADADDTFEDKGDASSGADNAVENSLENGMGSGNVELEKGDQEESCSAGLEKIAEIGDAVIAQDNGQDSRQA